MMWTKVLGHVVDIRTLKKLGALKGVCLAFSVDSVLYMFYSIIR